MKHKIKNKKYLVTTLLLVFSFLIILFPSQVYAVSEWFSISNIGEKVVLTLLGVFAGAFQWLLGLFIGIIISSVIDIAQYNNFINEDTIVKAWVIVRDLSNMFFVLILLIIAFATILRVENYSIKKLLPKVLLMAILVNFSRTICGVIIDFAQVIMLTFINAVHMGGGGSIINTLGVDKYITTAKSVDAGQQGINFWSAVVGLILSCVFLLIAGTVLITLLTVLVTRMVMIWIYIVLSPLAFVLSAFPQGQKYSNQWWEEFSKNVVSGPLLAFFLWLAVMASNNIEIRNLQETTTECYGPLDIMCPGSFLNFIIAIGFLLGGLAITEKMGGAVGKIAGKGSVWGQRFALSPVKGAKSLANFGINKLHEKQGIDLNVKRVAQGLKAARETKRQRGYLKGMEKAGQIMDSGGRIRGMLAMSGSPKDAWEQITRWKKGVPVGLVKRFKGGKRMRGQVEKAEGYINSSQAELDSLKGQRRQILSQDDVDRNQRQLIEFRKEEADYSLKMQPYEGKSSLTKDEKKIYDKLDAERRSVRVKIQKIETDNRPIDNERANDLDAQIKVKEKEHKTIIEQNQPTINKNQPEFNFEARVASSKMEGEMASQIKDISEPTELLAILRDAIGKNKPMIKAVMKKMTRDYNDNEFLEPLVGNSGFRGVQELMKALAGKSDNPDLKYLDSGFSFDEAAALGQEIGEINKNTNHWEATYAFEMKNGRWREMSEKDHYNAVSIETGKIQPRQLLRGVNRLGYGYHDEKGGFHLTRAASILLHKYNNPDVVKRIGEDLNESAAQYIFEGVTDEDGNLKEEFKSVIPEQVFEQIKVKYDSTKEHGKFNELYEKTLEIWPENEKSKQENNSNSNVNNSNG